MKKCKKCNNRKQLEDFPKDSRLKDKRRNVCKQCVNERFMKWKEKSGFRDYQKLHYEENKESIMETNRRWIENNRHYVNAKARKRRKTDLNYKLKQYLRNRVYSVLNNSYKSGSAVRDLGCSVDQLKSHLEAQFKPGMSWDNYGKNGWHIDHITPLSLFDLSDRDQFKKACYFTNLQPLWAAENIAKSNKV